ncbi:PepSY domain-containing protein [Paenibacillus sp. SYP-B3998]|uniref:PepSY domain-containing protein n=1 Tax=Paenibacillus sp. SYP-B3998 TaxID=2678564 RepID=A0A6G3ZYQ4_9BACL|nr:PepSY domain-containing protein [Paenibacillus sp. SYP-B3998]NEW06711.1 PepSY domain-containing protein [Paenibacillus sp. SYP-B3998]
MTKKTERLHRTFWRWHFYAGLFIVPLILTLSLSGIAYLFKADIEDVVYKDLYFGSSQQTEYIKMSQAITATEGSFPDYKVTKIAYFNEDKRNTRLSLYNSHLANEKYIYLDSNNQIVGSQNANDNFSNVTRNLHSSLLVGGTVVNYLVELAACWAVFLIVTGLYMSWSSRKKLGEARTLRQGYKQKHTLVGVIFTIPLLVLIVSGLPWSAFMGNQIYKMSTAHHALGFPALYVTPPESKNNHLPWATRKENPPESANEKGTITMDSYEGIALSQGINKPFVINLPSSEKDVITVSRSTGSGITGMNVGPSEEITSYFDQYSGELISKIDYQDYGILAQWFTYGIPLHEGHLFGRVNQILCLLTTLSLLFLMYWGIKMWFARKPKGKFSAPPKQKMGKDMISFLVIMVILGVAMPLFGMSLLVIAVLEFILYLFRTRNHTIGNSHSG